MKVFLKGKRAVALDQNSFIADGGQGNVYAKGGIAYKIYKDPAMIIPYGKITELAALDHEDIIRPVDIILDKKKNFVGYTMRYVKDSMNLCRIFTRSFKNRHNITPERITNLVEVFRSMLSFVHSKGILIVDLNEMNFLLDADLSRIYFIDVDNYQTMNFPCVAVMDSIRDRHMKVPGQGSDWFSWGILTFQMFMGIHPYKGKYKHTLSLDERMKQNISVFNRDVNLPGVCPPFETIPRNWLAWYKALFEQGKRIPPPGAAAGEAAILPQITRIDRSGQFEITQLEEYNSNIVDYVFFRGTQVVTLTDSLVINSRVIPLKGQKYHLGISPRLGHIIGARREAGQLKLMDFTANKEIPVFLNCDGIVSYEGSLYIKNGGHLYFLNFIETEDSLKAGFLPGANVMEKGAMLLEGCVFQKLLDTPWFFFFPKENYCRQVKIPGLAAFRIIEGKYENRVLMATAFKDGKYHRFMFRFTEDFSSYDFKEEEDISLTELNFTVLENGIGAALNPCEGLELFFNRKDHDRFKEIHDPILPGIRLTRRGNETLFFRGKKLFRIKMK